MKNDSIILMGMDVKLVCFPLSFPLCIYGEDAAAKIEREVVADLIGDYLFTDKAFVENLAKENPGLFQRIFEEIKHLCKLVTAGSKEARQLEKVKKIFQDAYRAEIKNPTAEGEVMYSLMAFEKDGRRFVEIDQDQDRFDGHSKAEYPRIAKDIINEKFNGKVIGIDNKMFVNGSGRDEFSNPSKRIDDNLYEVKMRTAGELDNLLDAGINIRNVPDGEDGHIHPDVVNGFDHIDTLFKIGDKYFKAVVNIKNIKRGKLFKDVTKIEDVTQDIMDSYGKDPKFQFLRTSSMDSIRNPEGKVNKNSLSAQGQVETEGQGWQVQGRDVALEQEQEGPGVPMPPGYQKGNPVAGATQKGSKASQTAREIGPPLPGEPARVQSDRADGNLTSPEDAIRAEQQSLDQEYRRQAGFNEDPSLYDTDEDEGVETTRDKLEVKRDNLRWEMNEDQRNKEAALQAKDQLITELQAKYDAQKHKDGKNSQALLK